MMYHLLFFVLNNAKSLEVRFTETAPVIDGYIEEVWSRADSAYDFIQCFPYEKEKPTDNTMVYLLQDENNLYVAFRCWTLSSKPVNQMSENDDAVVLYLDPFGSKTTAYSFAVHISGIYSDGMIFDDGRVKDDSWDGVWEYGVKTYDDRYEVEIKIPFKSIRYKKGLSEWGINFKRYISAKQETDYWTEVLQVEGNLVSKYGTLKNINPQAKGYYFEVYPEGFVRNDRDTLETKTRFSGSLNLKWDITPQMTLNATAFPDFAQIESDPFELNLTRYETYLSERRPFFLEGTDIFRMSDFGQMSFFQPLRIFYSRRIGKLINNEFVPIIGGLKLTSKSERLGYGILGAYTGALRHGDTLIEPARGFGVIRAKRGVLRNSDIGMLFSGSAVNSDTYNYALGIDGAYRSGPSQLIIQGAFSDKNRKKGWAFNSGYMGFMKNFLTLANAQIISDSFDVKDIGYVPWVGMKKFMLFTGPYWNYPKGALRNLWIGFGGGILQEPGDTLNWSKIGYASFNPNFRNNWGGNLEVSAGPHYEVDTNYLFRSVNLSIWGHGARYNIWFGGNLNYTYNYYRNFLAYQGSTWHGFYWTIMPRVGVELSSNSWIEWDTTNTIIAIWPMATPEINFTITPKMEFSLFNEFVFTIPGTDFDETKFFTNRFGFLFSYNFKPKSWLYIALNDYREDAGDGLKIQNQVGAIKAKYLVYF